MALYGSERRQSPFLGTEPCVPGAGPRDSLCLSLLSQLCVPGASERASVCITAFFLIYTLIQSWEHSTSISGTCAVPPKSSEETRFWQGMCCSAMLVAANEKAHQKFSNLSLVSILVGKKTNKKTPKFYIVTEQTEP